MGNILRIGAYYYYYYYYYYYSTLHQSITGPSLAAASSPLGALGANTSRCLSGRLGSEWPRSSRAHRR
jgi:hypothetical protein